MWRVSLFSSALAAWTFVVYGIIFGVALGINQYWRKKKMPVLPGFVSWMLTFFVVDIALLFFRSVSLPAALAMVASLFNLHHPLGVSTLAPNLHSLTYVNLAMLVAGIAIAFFGKSSDELSREFKPTVANVFATAGVFVACCLFMAFNSSQNFLYFQF